MNKYPWQGLKVKIHPFFWTVIFLSVWTGHFIEVMTLFGLVIIHEMGHVTAAWSYGWTVRTIELLPFGGVAVMDEWGNTSAKEEIVVALAGPFHHIWMILLSYLFFQLEWWSQEWTEYFIMGNTVIAVFNLLPIYPLDGGRILQALISYWLPYRKCIHYTCCFSLVLSCGVILIAFMIPGIMVYPSLLLIGIFLLISNIVLFKKQQYQFLRFLLHRLNDGIPENVPLYKISVSSHDQLPRVIDKWYRERYHVLEVTDQRGKILGWLTEEKVLRSYFNRDWVPMKEFI